MDLNSNAAGEQQPNGFLLVVVRLVRPPAFVCADSARTLPVPFQFIAAGKIDAVDETLWLMGPGARNDLLIDRCGHCHGRLRSPRPINVPTRGRGPTTVDRQAASYSWEPTGGNGAALSRAE